jgi:hypothetical protein
MTVAATRAGDDDEALCGARRFAEDDRDLRGRR